MVRQEEKEQAKPERTGRRLLPREASGARTRTRAVAAQQRLASAPALSVVIGSSAPSPTHLPAKTQSEPDGARHARGSASSAAERRTHTNNQLAAAGHKERALRRRCQPALAGRVGPANNEVPFHPTSPALFLPQPRTSPSRQRSD